MTICANCKHCKPLVGPYGEIWKWSECRAHVVAEARKTKNVVSGIITEHPAEYRYCSDVNDGNCRKYEPRPPAPQPEPRLSWWRRIWRAL